jgi:hypothetical protein
VRGKSQNRKTRAIDFVPVMFSTLFSRFPIKFKRGAVQLAFKIVRTNGFEKLIAETDDLYVGRAAYDEARRLYPKDLIELRSGTRILATTRPRDQRP